MKLITLFFLFMITTGLNAQWSGTYSGFANGDNARLTLEQNGTVVTGQLQDSYQTFEIAGTVTNQQFVGTATENSLQLVFDFYITLSGDLAECKLAIEVLGSTSESMFTLSKAAQSGTATAQVNSAPSKIPFPNGATFPSALVATWTKNETYNSGYGDNYMGSNFSQSMTLFADGSVSEGASSASMSGSDYYNQSSGEGSGKLDGVGWYAKDKELYMIAYSDGSWQSVHLGRWYSENSSLLITSPNGEKILLSR